MLLNLLRPSNLLAVEGAVPSDATGPSGFVLMRKLPGEPWQLVNVLLDGLPPTSTDELRVQQALVGGYVEGVGHPTDDHPYRLVCNEGGRELGLKPSTTAYGRFGSSNLLGPVLLVRCRRDADGWSSRSMTAAMDPSLCARVLARSLGLLRLPASETLDERLVDVRLASAVTKG